MLEPPLGEVPRTRDGSGTDLALRGGMDSDRSQTIEEDGGQVGRAWSAKQKSLDYIRWALGSHQQCLSRAEIRALLGEGIRRQVERLDVRSSGTMEKGRAAGAKEEGVKGAEQESRSRKPWPPGD